VYTGREQSLRTPQTDLLRTTCCRFSDEHKGIRSRVQFAIRSRVQFAIRSRSAYLHGVARGKCFKPHRGLQTFPHFEESRTSGPLQKKTKKEMHGGKYLPM
jgi:hypothetical protein